MNNLHTIRKAEPEDIPVITDLAYRTWFATYEPFIPYEQVAFMFGEIYTPESIYKQMTFLGHTYLLLFEEETPMAYASYGALADTPYIYKLHKIYILPEQQGKKLGQQLIHAVENIARAAGARTLQLNVNRENTAKFFYERMGYHIVEEQDIPIGQYWMNDYLMEKSL